MRGELNCYVDEGASFMEVIKRVWNMSKEGSKGRSMSFVSFSHQISPEGQHCMVLFTTTFQEGEQK